MKILRKLLDYFQSASSVAKSTQSKSKGKSESEDKNITYEDWISKDQVIRQWLRNQRESPGFFEWQTNFIPLLGGKFREKPGDNHHQALPIQWAAHSYDQKNNVLGNRTISHTGDGYVVETFDKFRNRIAEEYLFLTDNDYQTSNITRTQDGMNRPGFGGGSNS